jgi:hypothetical protein
MADAFAQQVGVVYIKSAKAMLFNQSVANALWHAFASQA